jgi:hypothetical protein
MTWKHDLDALVESTMMFVQQVNGRPTSSPAALKVAEQALAETARPVDPPAPMMRFVLPASERDQILERINNFRSHQAKLAREHEDYYLQVKAKMTPNTPPLTGGHTRQ